MDLGAGAGSRLLRARCPQAAVTCVDNDPQMLELLHGQGFAVVEAGLDDGFPALIGAPAGFQVTDSEVTAAAPVTPAAREYAQQRFARFSHLTTLSDEDRDATAPAPHH